MAHTFDDMTSDRPYRLVIFIVETIAENKRCASTQLDPEVVKALLRIPVAEIRRGWSEIGR